MYRTDILKKGGKMPKSFYSVRLAHLFVQMGRCCQNKIKLQLYKERQIQTMKNYFRVRAYLEKFSMFHLGMKNTNTTNGIIQCPWPLGTYLEQTFLFLLSITICHLSAEEELFWDSTLLIIFIFLKTSKPYFELFVGLKWLDLSMSSVVCLYVYLMSNVYIRRELLFYWIPKKEALSFLPSSSSSVVAAALFSPTRFELLLRGHGSL